MNISKSEFNYMVECTARDVATMLVERQGTSIVEALDTLYNSQTYEAMLDPQSTLYFQSPRYVYSCLESEMKTGRMF